VAGTKVREEEISQRAIKGSKTTRRRTEIRRS
jgi:hypothetical protein